MPSGSDIRVPPRALSAAKQGRAERPGAAGSPAGAEEVHSLPTQPGTEKPQIRKSPTRGNRVGLFAVHSTSRDGNLAREGGVVRSDIRVPELCEGGCPCRSEDEHRRPHNLTS